MDTNIFDTYDDFEESNVEREFKKGMSRSYTMSQDMSNDIAAGKSIDQKLIKAIDMANTRMKRILGAKWTEEDRAKLAKWYSGNTHSSLSGITTEDLTNAMNIMIKSPEAKREAMIKLFRASKTEDEFLKKMNQPIRESFNLLDYSINESDSEFDNGSPASPSEHFDKANSGEWKISVPGGTGENPNAKPADGEMGPVNAKNMAEAPTAKPYDANSISIPGKATLTVDQYNQAISQLQRSFKEGAELLAALQQAEIIQEKKATEEEQAAMKLMTEMAETKPIQFNEWVCSTTGCIFDTLKQAADKNSVDIEKEKTWKAALKNTEVIAEKLDELVKQVQELGTKAGKDVKAKVERVKDMFTKVVCVDCEKKDK